MDYVLQSHIFTVGVNHRACEEDLLLGFGDILELELHLAGRLSIGADHRGCDLGSAVCDGLADTRKPYLLANSEVNVLVRIGKWQHAPVYAVAAVTLRRVVDADVCEAAEYLLAGSRILTSGAIARALRI